MAQANTTPRVSLVEYAKRGFAGIEQPQLTTGSREWYAYELGRYLNASGRSEPRYVSLARDNGFFANDMRFHYVCNGDVITFERIE